MKSKLRNQIGFILVIISALCLYLASFPHVNVGFGDSDLLAILGYFGGVAHPPGYPLFILLTFLFTHLPLPLSIAGRANLLSVLLSALTLGFLYLSVRLFQTALSRFDSLKTQIIALLSVTSLMLLAPYWLFSLVSEKYALNLLLSSILIYLCLHFIVKPLRQTYPVIILYLLLGLALTTHLTLWFLLPMVIYTLYPHRPPAKALLGLILGILIPLTILILLNLNTAAPLSWHFEKTIPGFINHLSMRAYFRGTPETRPLSPTLFQSIGNYLQFLVSSYGWLASILTVFGVGSLVRQSSPKTIKLILVGAGFTLLSLPLLLRWPSLYSGQAIVQRQYIIGYLFLPFFFAGGLNFFLKRLKAPSSQSIFLSLTALALLARLIYLFPHLNLKSDQEFSFFYHQILSDLPLEGQIFCFGDVSCFALLYDQLVNGSRPDVSINIEAKNFLPRPSPELTVAYLHQNLPQNQIHFFDLNQKYYDLLGFDTAKVYLTPQALSTSVSLTPPPITSQAALSYPYSDYLLTTNYLPIDPVRRQRLAGAAQRHLVNSMTAKIRQDELTFLNESNYAQKLSAKLGPPYDLGVQTVLKLYSENPYPKTSL